MTALPIDPVLPYVLTALSDRGVCVLQAPPGAGKTTRVPLHLIAGGLCKGRILMLEPRRVAARAAAERLADALGETPGGRVGYRMRGTSVAGRDLEVVTEGILTRMIQSDPALIGVGCVIFDEFHERSLQADLGLALTLEIRGALRDDLKILVMSATLDAAPVAALMGDAPVVTSRGRAFPVETHWLDHPLKAKTVAEYARAVAGFVTQAVAETTGGVLVFLPGVGEIRRVASLLDLPAEVHVLPLHGGLPFAEQRRAIAPLPRGRKLVLSTAIAETSLTLEDIRVVVDGGRARRARFDPGNGMSRLVTDRVTRAEATQRQGRAGRVAPGVCYRLWMKGEEGALAAFPPPEIAAADLAPLALDLAMWGARDAGDLAFLTPPPEGTQANARDLLRALGALDGAGALTDHGRRLAAIPTHPRLAHMLVAGGGPMAAPLASLCAARPGPRDTVDLLPDLRSFAHNKTVHSDTRAEAKRLARFAGPDRGLSAGALLSLAYPDRIALRRKGAVPRYLLSGGSGAVLVDGDTLAAEHMLVAADLDGNRREARIRRAIVADEADIRDLHAHALTTHRRCDWSRRARRVQARETIEMGALVLQEQAIRDLEDQETIPAMIEGIRDLGLDSLNWTKAARLLQARLIRLHPQGPDARDPALLDQLEDWLAPHLGGCRTVEDLAGIDIRTALLGWLNYPVRQALDRLLPPEFVAPTGTRVPIDYGGDQPRIAVRLQELFGLTAHPCVGPGREPLLIELLSPARRPVQTTADLPGFWRTSYADVRKDMRGRYPKHPWPENPAEAVATRRVKPKGR